MIKFTASNGEAVLDFSATAKKAKKMTTAELKFSIADCKEARDVSWENMKSDIRVHKTDGYYQDEMSVYSNEIADRQQLINEINNGIFK